MNLDKYDFQEKDAILALFSGELLGLSTGMIATDRNENKIAILGFSDKWLEDQTEQVKKTQEVPNPSMSLE